VSLRRYTLLYKDSFLDELKEVVDWYDINISMANANKFLERFI